MNISITNIMGGYEALVERLPDEKRELTTTAAQCEKTFLCNDGNGCGYRHCPANTYSSRHITIKKLQRKLKDD